LKIPIFLVPTHRCVLECEYCGIVRTKIDESCTRRWLDDIDKLASVASSFSIYGGEPLLYAGLDKMLDKIKSIGFRTHVSTTAPPMLIRRLDTGVLDGISVSIDTMRFDSLTRCSIDSAQKSRWGVSAVKRFGDRPLMQNFVGITVTDKNVAEVRGILDWLQGTNFRVCLNLVQVDDTKTKSLATSVEGVIEAENDEIDALLEYVVENIDRLPMADDVEFYKMLRATGSFRCAGLGVKSLFVDSDGQVAVCMDTLGRKIGDVDSFLSQDYRRYFEVQDACSGCSWGCMYTTYKGLTWR